VKPENKINLTESIFLVTTALGNVYSDFLSDRDISGVRQATLTFYKNELQIFLKWAGGSGAKELSDITPDLLRAYFMDLRKRRNQNGIHKNYTAIKTWLRWAWGEYEQPGNCPIAKIKIASPKKKQQPAISLETFSMLLKTYKGRNAKRDRAILLFLLDTGIRRQEICNLKISQLMQNGMVQLEANGTKTGEPRKVFLIRITRQALNAYLAERGAIDGDAPLFATKSGEPLAAAGMRQIIRRRCTDAGLPEKGMHSFRRGFALETWRETHDLEAVSRLLGHSSTKTTRDYLPLEDEDLRLVHERTSPINRLKHK
jgi:integrase/recombinase XerD